MRFFSNKAAKKERAFLKKGAQKTFVTFTRDIETSPGGKLTKVFCGAFFQKSDRFLKLLACGIRRA